MKKNIVLLLVSLILISCSIHPKNVVGSVDGRQIPSKYYFNSLREKTATFSINKGRNPNQKERKKIEDKTWKQIVEKIVYEKLYSENRLSVSNEEIENYLINNIPGFLKNNPKLMSHHKFSESLYLSSVKTDIPLNLEKLRKEVYYVILNKKLREKVLRNYTPTEAEIKRKLEKYSVSGDVEIYQFYPDNFNFEVTETEIRKYYTDNINDFRTEAFVDLQYVKFPIKLGKIDFEYTKHIADSLFTEFKKGVSFALVVNQPSKLYFGEEKPFTYVDSLNSTVKKQLSKLSENHFGKPFLYKNSYYILNLQRRTKNMVKYMVLEIPVKPTDSTLNAVKNKVIDFKELSDEIGFDKAAIETNHVLINTGKIFLRNPVIAGLGRSDTILLKALKNKNKYIPEFHPYLNEYILFYVKNKQLNGVKRISDCKKEISKKIVLQKMKRKLANSKNKVINALIKSGKSKINKFVNVNYNDFEKTCVGFEILKKSLFRDIQVGKYTKPVQGENSVFLAKWLKINKRIVPDNKYRDLCISELKANYFKKYIAGVFKKTKINDWRSNN